MNNNNNNYGSQSPYPPNNPYPPYPNQPPPANYNAYPPSQPPPPLSHNPDPNYPPPHPYPYPYPPQSYPPAPPSNSGHLGYQHNAYPYPPAPHGSFHYDPSQSHYPYQHPTGQYPSHDTNPLGHANSFPSDTPNPSSTSYLPIDHKLSNVHLSDDHRPFASTSPLAPSTFASPPAPSAPLVNFSVPSSSEGASVGGAVSAQPNLATSYAHSSSFDGMEHMQDTQIVPLMNNNASLRVLLLHGNLDIWVYEAKNLPNMDMIHKTFGGVFTKTQGDITSDPYVSVSLANAVIARTFVINNDENPVWTQHFYVPVAHNAAELHFAVKDSDVVGSELIGIVAIPVEQIYSGARVEGVYPVLNTSGRPCKAGATLRISVQYIPAESLSIYHHGVGVVDDYPGVPGTYFPLRKGGKVTLYQDAHVPDGCLPRFDLDHGMSYAHGKCWHDICEAILRASRLIYITGWSVFHQVRLVRDSAYPSDSTLGDILKSKSQEGVRVLLLVWDDPTSRSIMGIKTDGIMGTGDEETRRFFKHSSVQVLLCPRIAGKKHSWVKQREVETIYTHHQKTVILDADAGNNRRKIIAFVGGLDLCGGRYDTPEHPLFRTLQTVHKDDYHNPNFTGSVVGCPREPWHDLHCKIDGPAAYDVLTNFEERWSLAAKPRSVKKLTGSHDDTLLKIDRVPDIVGIFETFVTKNDPETWDVQIFRSIDSSSVKGFPKDPREATNKNLVCGKNVLIDMSIHSAYVKAIRSAQNFIYIENQYFLGSSYNWDSYKDVGANNLIPMEIALKIADKIKAKERFAAYIVVPMWPEGNPTGTATQRILFWQHKTMQMMYETIYKALVEAGVENEFTPEDYLNFFCLGNREVLDVSDDASEKPVSAAANTPQAKTRKSRRFMIYVHSKGMIVDDEYVILGSANINQRSMEGTRDTEIAMGAYQPLHTWVKKQSSPRGQIHGYRISLWAEHTGMVDDCFTQPESLECVRKVRNLGKTNWLQYAADVVFEMRGHLLKYPVDVDRQGKVSPLPECETFPDFGGNIVGSFGGIQENLTI